MFKRVMISALALVVMAGCGGSGTGDPDDLVMSSDGAPMNIYQAAEQGDFESVVRYMQTGQWDPTRPDDTGLLPLTAAAKGGNAEIVKLMVQYGANVNQRDVKGNTPLAVAEKAGHKEVAQVLRELGATE